MLSPKLVLIALLSIAAAARADSVPAQGRFANLNGIQMYYETYGQGTPLVALHGFGGSSADWGRFVAGSTPRNSRRRHWNS